MLYLDKKYDIYMVMDKWFLKGDIFEVFLTSLSDSSVGIINRPLGVPSFQ